MADIEDSAAGPVIVARRVLLTGDGMATKNPFERLNKLFNYCRKVDYCGNLDPTKPQPGTAGVMRVAYAVTSNNGSESGRLPVSQVPSVVAQPTIHYFGTKADPRWGNIARCEEGGSPSLELAVGGHDDGVQRKAGCGVGGRDHGEVGGEAHPPRGDRHEREDEGWRGELRCVIEEPDGDV